MTEAELMAVAHGYRDNAISLTAIYLSVVTAYLFVAYTAGKNLTFSQVLIINAFFVVVGVFLIAAQFSLMISAQEAAKIAREISTWQASPYLPYLSHVLQVFFLLFIPVCLKFMWDIRRPSE